MKNILGGMSIEENHKLMTVTNDLCEKVYEVLKDVDYSTSANVLTIHLQRIICDKSNEKRECHNLCEEILDDLVSRINRLLEIKQSHGH